MRSVGQSASMGLAEGLLGWCALEEAMPKLLFSECQGRIITQNWPGVWRCGRQKISKVSCRALRQGILRAQKTRRRKGNSISEAQKQNLKRKLKRMVGEGPYRKGLNCLIGSVAHFTSDEEIKWAEKLLPAGPGIQDQARLQTRLTASGDEDDHPLKGVRYAALTARGPSGARPEHAKDVLGIRRRHFANRWLRAIEKVHEKAAAGMISEHRSQLA